MQTIHAVPVRLVAGCDRPATIFSTRSGMLTSCRWISIRPDSIRDTSRSSVMSRVTRSASALTVSSITRFWSSVNRLHLASNVAVKPFTLVSGDLSSWATVESRSARLRSSLARCSAPRSVTTRRSTAPGPALQPGWSRVSLGRAHSQR